MNPNILGVSASVKAPVDFPWKSTMSLNHQGVVDSLNATLFWVDEDFAKTYQLEVVKGQFLQMNYSDYWKERETAGKNRKEGKEYTVSVPVVINETAEKQLGFADPIGQRIGDKVIVGVVKDFHFRPLQYPISPVILLNNPETMGTMNVKIASNDRASTLKYIGEIYRKHRDQRAFSYSFFDDLLNEKYPGRNQAKKHHHLIFFSGDYDFDTWYFGHGCFLHRPKDQGNRNQENKWSQSIGSDDPAKSRLCKMGSHCFYYCHSRFLVRHE